MVDGLLSKKMVKNFSAILVFAVLFLNIIGYVYCQQNSNGVEWFQSGNTKLTIPLQSKLPIELEDNRIGGYWHGLWQLPAGLQDILNDEILGCGLKRVRLAINALDVEMVNWSVPEFSIDPRHDEWITDLAEVGVTITYVLSFWDKARRAEGETGFWNETGDFRDYPRFKTEDEIQRYLDFVRFIVQNFKDRVQYFEIWNEPNTESIGQYIELADYIELVKRVIPVIREEYPEAKIEVGGIPEPFDHYGRPYLLGILSSEIMPLVNAVCWHPFYGSSPGSEGSLRQEYYYNYSVAVQEIIDVASSNGFEGEYIADELQWLTDTESGPESARQGYSEIIAAKYLGRGIVMHLGMNITVGLGVSWHPSLHPYRNKIVRNLCTIMAGAEPITLPVEIQSEATNIRSYGFSLPNGDKLFALWTDGVAIDEDAGVEANLTCQGFGDYDVIGIDVLESFQQPLTTSSENGNLVIQNLIVRDYPLILRVYTKLLSTILCSASRSEINEGASISVSGSISPPVSGVKVTLTYTKPDGSTLTRIAATNNLGNYSDTYAPDMVGSWSVTVLWEGDTTLEGAMSSGISFTVKKGCIIATATYGSDLSPEVQFLRNFRENIVLTTFTGQQFMAVFNAIYYSFSPTVAAGIASNEAIRGVTRSVLYPLIRILQFGESVTSLFSLNADLGIIVFCLVVSALLSLVYLVPWALFVSYLKKRVVSAKSIRYMSYLLAVSVIVLLVAVTARSPILTMAGGTFAVLATTGITTLLTVRVIMKRLIIP